MSSWVRNLLWRFILNNAGREGKVLPLPVLLFLIFLIIIKQIES
ncbi:hypothetical protein NSP_37600 [Nodularia spumigena CCY9414]|nr:hypothetical protein NSP_37600 [Nodularia spumigena CCY9414]